MEQKTNILVVKDDVYVNDMLRGLLGRKGFSVQVSTSGSSALEMLGHESFDLVLLDLLLPDIDGFKLMDHIHRHKPDTRIIIMTNYASVESTIKAFRKGAKDFISNPYAHQELLTIINNSVAQKLAEIEKKRIEEELRRFSYSDGLTGIANRRFFEETFNQEWRRAARSSKSLSLIIGDIDYFKAYNDTYGHLQGDECLKQVAQALKSILKRPGDMVARYGGEEFMALLPDTSEKDAARIAEAKRVAVESLKIEHSQSPINATLTISLGVATTIPDKDTASKFLVAACDDALYRAKTDGRNRVKVSTLEHTKPTNDELTNHSGQ